MNENPLHDTWWRIDVLNYFGKYINGNFIFRKYRANISYIKSVHKTVTNYFNEDLDKLYYEYNEA